jgi:AraC-like DNA-binding protein
MLATARFDRLKVSDIAYACGFSDVSYFNRCFRRRFGCSPRELRANNAG